MNADQLPNTITTAELEQVHEDGYPDPESLADMWTTIPELAPPLIHNVLRQGHKMLIAGPSKAGKSYALIELCWAIATGTPWMGFNCAKGRVLYVNLELDRASCSHRFLDIHKALCLDDDGVGNIDIWNLRGKTIPMDKLTPKLIWRAMKKNYIAIVIDPIYKVITGNENSADQMAHFCNQFDKVCTELGCAVIYCHHHSKGDQSWKRSMDRASGSGVFARDPDALLDIIELELPPTLRHDDVTAWRVSGTLREFKAFSPVDVWFNHPLHTMAHFKEGENVATHSELKPHQRALNARKSKDEKLRERNFRLEAAFATCVSNSEIPTIKTLAKYLGTHEQTVRNSVDEHEEFLRENGVVKHVSGDNSK